MSIRVGGARHQPAQVRHISKCLNPHCGNTQLTRLQDYVACNKCGWNTRMNAQDIIDTFGVYPAPEAVDDTGVGTSGEGVHSSTVLPSAADLDAVAAETQAAEATTAILPRLGEEILKEGPSKVVPYHSTPEQAPDVKAPGAPARRKQNGGQQQK